MPTIRISTTQNIEIDYEVADLGERIVAYLIDLAIFLLIFILGLIFVNAADVISTTGLGVIIIACIYFALFVFYDLVCEVFMNGQSVGKRVMKIKVISLSGGQPSLGQYLMRWMFRIVDFLFTWPFAIVALISVAVTTNKQRIGDIVAGTTLIRTSPRTKRNHVAFTPAVTNYNPVYSQASQLTDQDAALIHEVVQTYMKTQNAVVVYNMASRIQEHLKIEKSKNLNDLQFLQTILKDYSHIIAQETV